MVSVGFVAGGLGLALGWIARSLRTTPVDVDSEITPSTAEPVTQESDDPTPAQNQPEEKPNAPQEREKTTDKILYRLRELAENIAFDVEEHSETVNKASDRLRDDDATTNAVLDAVAEIMAANDFLHHKLNEAERKLNDQAKTIANHVKESRTDALTQVANRRAFDAEFAEAKTEYTKNETPVCLMMLDVDHFKQFNDQYGHLAGDEVLQQVATSLRRSTKHDAQVFRYGGEEFAILFRQKNIEDILAFAEKIRANIGLRGLEFEGDVLAVTASSGVAQLDAGEDCAGAIKRADEALYEAKSQGRNQSYWNDGDMNHSIPEYDINDQGPAPHLAFLTEPLSTDNSNTPSPWRSQVSTRREYLHDVCRRIAALKRNGGQDSCLILRIDDFEGTLAREGFDTSDIMLRATAQFLKASVRDMDHIAIYDEDTFAVWLPTAALLNASRISERLRAAIARCKVPTTTGSLSFSVSIGVTQIEVGDTHETIMERCERAMLKSSEHGGNRCFAASGTSFAAISEDAEFSFE